MTARTFIAAIALAAASVAGSASANTSAVDSMQNVQFSVRGEGQITVTITGNTATLSGFANGRSRTAAERAVLSHPRINKVINLVLTQS